MPKLLTRKPQQERSLVAAASRVHIDRRGEARRLQATRQDWQPRVWGYFDTIGEVKYSTNFLGNAMSKLKLFVGEKPDDPTQPLEPTDNATVMAPLDRLQDANGSHAEIMRPAAVHFTVPGECYLIGLDAETTGAEEEWSIRSIDEVIVKGEKVSLKDGPEPGSGRQLSEARDFILRLWQPHPRFTQLADSPLRGVMNQCEELLMIERAVRAAATSRAAGAGILTVPDELSHLERDPTTAQGEGDNDPFMEELIEALITPIGDEGHANAVVPMVVRGKGEQLKELRHVTLDRPLDQYLEARTDRALKRLAQGLNVPIEVVLGLAGVNHWTAWQIEEATYKAHIEPLALVICASLTTGYLRPTLKAMGVPNPERYRIGFDPTELVVRPNRADDTKWAHGAVVISDETARKELGFGEDDKPDDDEAATRRAANQRAQAGEETGPPSQASVVTPEALAATVELTAEEQGSGYIEGGKPARPPVTAAAEPQKRSLGERLLAIDRQLTARLEAACDAAMRRVMEKVGAKLRSKIGKDSALTASVKRVGQTEVAATLGPSLVASLGLDDSDLVAGGFDALASQWDRWVSDAQKMALALVPGISEAERTVIQQRFDTHRVEAWGWLRDTLEQLAVTRLYDPEPSVPEVGEFDATVLVPFGVIREAVARAGGATGQNAHARTASTQIETSVRLEPELVSVGLAGGWEMRAVLAEHDNVIEGYEWVYGDYPRTSPFEPHEALDGQRFANFDDAVLVNAEPWPPTEFYLPGDHDGCRCDFMPIFAERQALHEAPEIDDPEITAGVEELVKQGRQNVEEVLAALQDVKDEVGGVDFSGLDFMLKVKPDASLAAQAKSKLRLAEKVVEAFQDGTVTSIEDGLAELKDIVRFTYVAEPDDYAAAVLRVQNEMKAAGFEQLKFSRIGWDDTELKALYKGTNASYRAPNGQVFELQVHTPESLLVKESKSHDPYELYRTLTATPRKKQNLAVKLMNIWKDVKLP